MSRSNIKFPQQRLLFPLTYPNEHVLVPATLSVQDIPLCCPHPEFSSRRHDLLIIVFVLSMEGDLEDNRCGDDGSIDKTVGAPQVEYGLDVVREGFARWAFILPGVAPLL